jgi:hypothetical protein
VKLAPRADRSLPSSGARFRAAVPRAADADGQPDLQGIWHGSQPAVWNIQDHSASLGRPRWPGDRRRPTRFRIVRSRWRSGSTTIATARPTNPERKCYMVGTPAHHVHAVSISDRADAQPDRDHFEYVHTVRSIRLSGQHPAGISAMVDGRFACAAGRARRSSST